MDKIEKWTPQVGDTFRLKGTEKPLYHLCGVTNYVMFSFVQEMENGIAGGEISEYDLAKNYELVERPQKIEDVIYDTNETDFGKYETEYNKI